MATELQDTLERILNKSHVFVEKYHALERSHADLEAEIDRLLHETRLLRQKNERLEQENQYLRQARVIVSDKTQVAATRELISHLVQDIDKCLAQLNE